MHCDRGLWTLRVTTCGMRQKNVRVEQSSALIARVRQVIQCSIRPSSLSVIPGKRGLEAILGYAPWRRTPQALVATAAVLTEEEVEAQSVRSQPYDCRAGDGGAVATMVVQSKTTGMLASIAPEEDGNSLLSRQHGPEGQKRANMTKDGNPLATRTEREEKSTPLLLVQQGPPSLEDPVVRDILDATSVEQLLETFDCHQARVTAEHIVEFFCMVVRCRAKDRTGGKESSIAYWELTTKLGSQMQRTKLLEGEKLSRLLQAWKVLGYKPPRWVASQIRKTLTSGQEKVNQEEKGLTQRVNSMQKNSMTQPHQGSNTGSGKGGGSLQSKRQGNLGAQERSLSRPGSLGAMAKATTVNDQEAEDKGIKRVGIPVVGPHYVQVYKLHMLSECAKYAEEHVPTAGAAVASLVVARVLHLLGHQSNDSGVKRFLNRMDELLAEGEPLSQQGSQPLCKLLYLWGRLGHRSPLVDEVVTTVMDERNMEAAGSKALAGALMGLRSLARDSGSQDVAQLATAIDKLQLFLRDSHPPVNFSVLRLVLAAEDVEQMKQLWDKYGHLPSFPIAGFISRVPKVARGRVAQQLVKSVLPDLEKRVQFLNVREVAMVLWAFGKLVFIPSRCVLQKLIDHLKDDKMLRMAKKQEVANALWGLGRISTTVTFDTTIVVKLLERAKKELHNYDTQGIANIALALAHLQVLDYEFLDMAAGEYQRRPQDFSSQEAANLLWVLVKLRRCSQELVRFFIDRVELKSSVDVASVLWSCAASGMHDVVYFKSALDGARPMIAKFGPQELANVMWACATSGYYEKETFTMLSEAAQRKLEWMNCQELANVAWAYSKSGHPDLVFFKAVIKLAHQRLSSFTPQGKSLLAWSCAVINYQDANFLDSLMDGLVEQLRKGMFFGDHECSNLSWAVAKLGHYHPEFLDTLANVMAPKMESHTEICRAQLLRAMAVLNHYHEEYLEAYVKLMKVEMEKPDALPPQTVAVAAHALAKLGYAEKDFAKRLANCVVRRMKEFKVFELCIMAWALTISGVLQTKVCRKIVERVEQALAGDESISEELLVNLDNGSPWRNQLFQMHIAFTDAGMPSPLKGSLLKECSENWRSAIITTSQIQTTVYDCLASQGLKCSIEESTEDGLFSIDVCIKDYKGAQVALEVDGPWHRARNDRTRLGGDTLMRNKCLQARGYLVVMVDIECFEKGWNYTQLGGYLLELIDAAWVEKFAASSG